MYRLRDIFPDLDVGIFRALIEDENARLFLTDFDVIMGEVHLRPLYEPRKEVFLEHSRSDELRWIFLTILGKAGRSASSTHGIRNCKFRVAGVG